MGALANLSYDDKIADETDSVGGKFNIFPSSIYEAEIKMAYIQNAAGADSQAMGINCTFDINGQEYKETFWVTGKNGKNYYVDKNSGDKKYLGGFITADALCLLGVGKSLSDLDTETKMVRIYNADAKAEVPTKVECLTDLLGATVKLGIQQQTVFKQAKDSAGKWQDTDETRDENVVDKVFRAKDLKTTSEIRAKAEEASFHALWTEKWEGQVKDRTKKKGAKGASKPGAPAGAATPKPTSNLFD